MFRPLNSAEKLLIRRLVEKRMLKGGPLHSIVCREKGAHTPITQQAIADHAKVAAAIVTGLPIPSMPLSLDELKVHYARQSGSFTQCVLFLPGGILFAGASHCSIKDPDGKIEGEMVALRRAVLFDRGCLIPEKESVNGLSVEDLANTAAALNATVEVAQSGKKQKVRAKVALL